MRTSAVADITPLVQHALDVFPSTCTWVFAGTSIGAAYMVSVGAAYNLIDSSVPGTSVVILSE